MKYNVDDVKMIHLNGPFGDETSSYRVEFPEDMTVEDFIFTILEKFPKEWGRFYVSLGKPVVKYRNGTMEVVRKDSYNAVKNMRMTKITANGGWSLMDYNIYIS